MADEQTNSSAEVKRLVKLAQEKNDERAQVTAELNAVRDLLKLHATLGEVGTSDQPTVGELFPRQFPEWVPEPAPEPEPEPAGSGS